MKLPSENYPVLLKQSENLSKECYIPINLQEKDSELVEYTDDYDNKFYFSYNNLYMSVKIPKIDGWYLIGYIAFINVDDGFKFVSYYSYKYDDKTQRQIDAELHHLNSNKKAFSTDHKLHITKCSHSGNIQFLNQSSLNQAFVPLIKYCDFITRIVSELEYGMNLGDISSNSTIFYAIKTLIYLIVKMVREEDYADLGSKEYTHQLHDIFDNIDGNLLDKGANMTSERFEKFRKDNQETEIIYNDLINDLDDPIKRLSPVYTKLSKYIRDKYFAIDDIFPHLIKYVYNLIKNIGDYDYVGNLYEYGLFEVELVDVKDTPYMDKNLLIYFFEDTNGNRLYTFSDTKLDFEYGDDYTIRAMVKKHENFKGIRQTRLTNVYIISHIPNPIRASVAKIPQFVNNME